MIISAKTAGWEGRLIAYVREKSAQSFRPGTLDCGLFFGGGVLAMTGNDFMAPFAGKYRTIDDAMKIAASLGFKDHIEYTASILPELPSPLHAQRGDGAVLSDIDGNDALGIVQGEGVYVMGLNGLMIAPLTMVKKAFRV